MRRITLSSAVLLLMFGRAAPLTAQDGFAFSVAFGYTGVNGDWGQILKNGFDADIIIDYLFPSGVRVGGGVYYASYDLEAPLEDESISNVQPTALLGYVFARGRVRPYVQLRGVVVRLRPEGDTFNTTPPDEEGENTAPQRWGTGGVGLAGVELAPSRYVTLDANVWYGAFTTSDVDLTAFGGPVFSSGRSWGVRLGVKWYPSP